MSSIWMHGFESALIVPAVAATGAICHDLATLSFRRKVNLEDRSFPIVLKESSRMILLGRIVSLAVMVAGPAAAFWFSSEPGWRQIDCILPLFISFMGFAFWVLVSEEKNQSIVINEDSFTFYKSAKKAVTVRATEITGHFAAEGNVVIKRFGHPKNLVISLEIWGPDRAYLRAVLERWQMEAIRQRNREEDMRGNVPGFGFSQDS